MKKIIHHTILPIGLGLAAGLPALAIEPPRDDAPPPPSVKTPASAPAPVQEGGEDGQMRPRIVPPAQNAQENKIAFIGVISAEVPDFLAAHLGIGAGEGVFVREVAPDSPAQKAGIEKFDVILRVSGKSVGSPAELSQQISTRKPDEEITLDLVHKGTEVTKTVKLETRPGTAFNRINDQAPNDGSLDLNGLPRDQADRVRDMLERRLRDMRAQQQQLQDEFDNMRPRRERGSRQDDGGLKGFHFKSDATFRLMDNDGSVEMKSSDGSKEITVRDRDNNTVWSGPWDTEEDKAAAPKEVRERIEKLKIDDNFRGNGFRFRFGPGFRDDGETR